MEAEETDDLLAVTTLAQGIARLTELDCPVNKIEKYIKEIQAICCGPIDDPFSKYYGYLLSPNDCLGIFLKNGGLQEHLKHNIEDGLHVTKRLLTLEKLSPEMNDFLAALVPHLVLSTSSTTIKPVLKMIWQHKDRDNMPIEMIESMLNSTEELETLLLGLYKDSSPDAAESCWKLERMNWLEWSSRSPFVFQTVTSLLNQLLIESRQKALVLKIVKEFIDGVLDSCRDQGRDIIPLYPTHCQTVVTLLKVSPSEIKDDPSCGPFETVLFQQLRPKLDDPCIGLMLLSHFSQWVPFVENKCSI